MKIKNYKMKKFNYKLKLKNIKKELKHQKINYFQILNNMQKIYLKWKII